jgi:endonuclease/exonuclease/phosphatase family metal-dependent hydrolase
MKIKILILFILSSFCFNIVGQNSSRIKIVTYNLLNYPLGYNTRNPEFKKVMDDIGPDIVVVQEITSLFGVNAFLNEVLDSSLFAAGPFLPGPDTESAIFYKDSLISLISHVTIPTVLRDISEFTLYHNFTLDTLIIYSVHLKASQGYTNEQQRLAEVNVLRNVTDNLPVRTNYIVAGDFNIYYAGEPAYQKLINQSTSGYFIDPLPAGNWHVNDFYASLHTQSTCGLISGCPNDGSGGGLDDRFDMILISQSIYDSTGIFLIENSNKAYGNDGLHFNKSINVAPFIVITQEIANALFNASDHLPVIAEFELETINSVDPVDPSRFTFSLFQNYPNPFNPTTTIKFEVPVTTDVKLVLYDLLGREIKVLYEGEARAGATEVSVSAEELNSGIYFYRLSTASYSSSKKLIVLK